MWTYADLEPEVAQLYGDTGCHGRKQEILILGGGCPDDLVKFFQQHGRNSGLDMCEQSTKESRMHALQDCRAVSC